MKKSNYQVNGKDFRIDMFERESALSSQRWKSYRVFYFGEIKQKWCMLREFSTMYHAIEYIEKFATKD